MAGYKTTVLSVTNYTQLKQAKMVVGLSAVFGKHLNLKDTLDLIVKADKEYDEWERQNLYFDKKKGQWFQADSTSVPWLDYQDRDDTRPKNRRHQQVIPIRRDNREDR